FVEHRLPDDLCGLLHRRKPRHDILAIAVLRQRLADVQPDADLRDFAAQIFRALARLAGPELTKDLGSRPRAFQHVTLAVRAISQLANSIVSERCTKRRLARASKFGGSDLRRPPEITKSSRRIN